MAGKPLIGFLTFHSETGTEGGYWAFQDKNFIYGAVECLRCNFRWRATEPPPYPGQPYDPQTHRIGIADNARCCKVDEHRTTFIADGAWGYEGLHILDTGDHLTIYSSKAQSKVLWEGDIKLIDRGLFKETAFGMWIHADQEGLERETWARWFLDQRPARLLPKE